ncbi:MAG: DUF523 domain-containing protein [Acidobacteriota bacterium]|nr:DUF523 domain-containing protein [Acidobacteriota bacterium]
MIKVLVSACLLGEKVRYDGKAHTSDDRILARWREEGRLVPVCPELAGGMGLPRPPAEIQGPGGGSAVLDANAVVKTRDGETVTEPFLAGAHVALALAKESGAALAILTEKSPSCGSTVTYDGNFDGTLIPGEGVTAALLRRNGLAVFSQNQLAEAQAWLTAREHEAS